LYSVRFLDTEHGWICGDGGVILKTENAGETWTADVSGTGSSLEEIYFIDATNGWIAGWNGTILKYDGSTWSLQTCPTTEHLYSIFILPSGTSFKGWAVGDNGTVIKTDDGITWRLPTTSIPTSMRLKSVFFVNEHDGWAVGYNGTVLQTDDGGDNWVLRTDITIYSPESVYFLSPTEGYIAGMNGLILKTSDGGLTWERQYSQVFGAINSIFFPSATEGWAVGDAGTIISTAPIVEIINKQQEVVPARFNLYANHPNPFNQMTTIEFDLPYFSEVTLTVYDLNGREVDALIQNGLPGGKYTINWQPGRMTSGVYFIRLQTPHFQAVRKCILLK